MNQEFDHEVDVPVEAPKITNFIRFGDGLNFTAVCNELLGSSLWNQQAGRKQGNSPHREADDLWVRFNEIPAKPEDWNELECVNYAPLPALPEVWCLVRFMMDKALCERLGRVMATRLKPGARIYPHKDDPAQTSYYTRFHVCLSAGPLSFFHCGDETVVMRPGEIWAFDNSREHQVFNNDTIDRLHLIVDMKLHHPVKFQDLRG